MVERMGSVPDLQCRMTVTGFPECRIIWLWVPKPTEKVHISGYTKMYNEIVNAAKK